jgi:uncharacterized protein involved in exopolysaccharide biosynthesis/Mrp family chromosome partitioning ATPase
LDYALVALRARTIAFVALSLIGVVVAVVLVRIVNPKHQAVVRVFVKPASQLLTSSMARQSFSPFGGSSEDEALIRTQLSLIESDKARQRIIELIDEESPGVPSLKRRLKDAMKVFLMGSKFVEEQTLYEKPYEDVYRESVIFEPDYDERSFVIGYKHRDAETAMAVTRRLFELLVEINSQIERDQSDHMIREIEAQLKKEQGELDELAHRVAEFVRRNGAYDKPAVVQEQFLYLERLRQTLDQRIADGARIRALLDATDSAIRRLRDLDADVASQAAAEEVEQIRQQLLWVRDRVADGDVAQERAAALQGRLRRAVDAVAAVPAEDVRRELLASLAKTRQDLEIEARSLDATTQSARESMTRQAEVLDRYPLGEGDFAKLMLEYEQGKKVYAMLTERLSAARIERESATPRLHVADEPSIRTFNATRFKFTVLMVAIAAAFAVGVFGIGLYDLFRQTVFRRAQLAGIANVKTLGEIPRLSPLQRTNLVSYGASTSSIVRIAKLIVKNDSMRIARPGAPRVIALSSEREAAGKSTTALVLAGALKGDGARVLVLDFDVRARTRNIVDFLNVDAAGARGAQEAQPTPRTTNVQGVDVTWISSDRPIMGGEARQLLLDVLARAKDHYDYVIIDSPPHFVPESLEIIQLADAVLICVPVKAATVRGTTRVAETIRLHTGTEAMVGFVLTMSLNLDGTVYDGSYRYGRYATPQSTGRGRAA